MRKLRADVCTGNICFFNIFLASFHTPSTCPLASLHMGALQAFSLHSVSDPQPLAHRYLNLNMPCLRLLPFTRYLAPQLVTAVLVTLLYLPRSGLSSSRVGASLPSSALAPSGLKFLIGGSSAFWGVPHFLQLDAPRSDCLQNSLLYASQPEDHVLHFASLLVGHNHLPWNRSNGGCDSHAPHAWYCSLFLVSHSSRSSSLVAHLTTILMLAFRTFKWSATAAPFSVSLSCRFCSEAIAWASLCLSFSHRGSQSPARSFPGLLFPAGCTNSRPLRTSRIAALVLEDVLRKVSAPYALHLLWVCTSPSLAVCLLQGAHGRLHHYESTNFSCMFW